MQNVQSIFGIFALLALAFAISENRRRGGVAAGRASGSRSPS